MSRPKRGRHDNDRRGLTVLEMLVSLSSLFILMTLTGMTFHLLLRTERMVSQSFVTERAISKLATDFRNDVHRATSATTPTSDEQADQELDLDLGNGTHVRYQSGQNLMTRLLVKGDTVAAREDFRLPDCQTSFLADASTPNLRRLRIERPGSSITRDSQAPRPLQPLVIEANLNRWPVTSVAQSQEVSSEEKVSP